MYDVFLSYTTRGATTKKWVDEFVQNLKHFFDVNFDKSLSVWYDQENEVGDNYRDEINEALKNSLVFLMILDPKYLSSPQTLAEVNEYKRVKTAGNQPEHYLKIIRWNGNKQEDLVNYIDSEILSISLTKLNTDGNEEDKQEQEYINDIQNIVKSIRKRQLQYARKTNTQKILQSLSAADNRFKVFIPMAYSGTKSKDRRSSFINQLSKTIEHNEKLKNIIILPDEIARPQLTQEDLADLFYEDNPDGRECLNALLDKSNASIVLLTGEKIKESEDLLDHIQFQLGNVKEQALKKEMPLHIFSDFPKEIYELPKFKKDADSENYTRNKNIKTAIGLDINAFIQIFIDDMESLLDNTPPPVVNVNKFVYIIEPYDPDNTATAEEQLKKKIELSKQHKRELRKYLFDKKLTLIPPIESKGKDFKDAPLYREKSLDMSDGVIIYCGTADDLQWCWQQQFDTYNIIKTKKKDIKRAVYVDPDLVPRNQEDYFFYGYDVILNSPKELDDFICKL